MKHYVEIPVPVKLLVEDDANIIDIFEGIKSWLAQELAWLETQSRPMWPRTSEGAHGLGADLAFQNSLQNRPRSNSNIEFIFDRNTGKNLY